LHDYVDVDSASGVSGREALVELVARAAAYSDEEVPQCLELDAEQLTMLTADDLPQGGVVSLPVLVPEDRLETPTAWVRLYGTRENVALLVEHEVDEDELPLPLSSRAYLEVLYRRVLAWSRRDPTIRAIYRSEQNGSQLACLEYQAGGAGKNLHKIAADGLDRAYRVERGVVEACNRLTAAYVDELVASPLLGLDAIAEVDCATTNEAKGKTLESLVSDLLVSVGGLKLVASRRRTPSEELDLVFHNHCLNSFMQKWGPIILVECKNWSSPVGASEFHAFAEKVRNRAGQCRVGIFVAWNGVTRAFMHEAVRRSRDPYVIVLLERSGIEEAIRSGDVQGYLQQSYNEAVSR
jgi:hypothetical protein